MRVTTRSTFWLATIYVALAVGLVAWMEMEMRAATRNLMAGNAELIGHEVSGALQNVSVEQLVIDDRAARKRLREAINATTRQSSVVSGLSVIDRDGRVVESDDSTLLGQQLAKPREEFSNNERPHFGATFSSLFDVGTYRLMTPLFKNDTLIGYIQMTLNNRDVARRYDALYWRFVVLVLTGLGAILTAGVLLHLHLSRLERRLRVMLQSGISGRAVAEVDLDDDFLAFGSFVQRLGKELHTARAGAQFARRERDVLARIFQCGTLLLGPDAELEFVNEVAKNLLTGGKPADLGKQITAISAPLDNAVKALHSSGLPSRDVDLAVTVDGRARRFHLELYAMDQQDRSRVLVAIKDQDMIDALEKDLRTAARFNGLATIYVGAAHDLRAPLNSMVVYLELMKQSVRRVAQSDGETTEVIQQRKYIEVIQQEINRLNNYVQALLDLTAPAKSTGGDLDLVQGLNEIASLIRVQAKLQGVALEWQLPDRSLLLNCKQVQLCQAFLNVIINALEAMPKGGVLTVRADSQNGVIAVDICDNGAGIPEALQPRVFDLHFTTKETHTGIGLYVARSVVEEHGGTLEVHSKLGCGACFRVRLPQNGKFDGALSGQ